MGGVKDELVDLVTTSTLALVFSFSFSLPPLVRNQEKMPRDSAAVAAAADSDVAFELPPKSDALLDVEPSTEDEVEGSKFDLDEDEARLGGSMNVSDVGSAVVVSLFCC